MEQFSSCYFCGDAVDASLDEYPVVPASVDPQAGERRTIVLCTNCKRKLDPVVEAVVDAVGDASVPVDRSGADVRERERSGSSDGNDAGTSTASDIGTTLGDDEDVLRPVGDDDATGDDDPSDDSENRRSYTSGQRAGGQPTGDDSEGSDGDGDDQGGDRDITLSRLENTNVMRLLQNREFPVERDDFVTVASSAYEISPSHCGKVLDLAVKHDLLREDDGQFRAGPEWR